MILLKNQSSMLRRAQHERKIFDTFSVIPVRPEQCRRVNGVLQQNHEMKCTLTPILLLGQAKFVKLVETLTGRDLALGKPGRPPKK